jgi:hypothetical protein
VSAVGVAVVALLFVGVLVKGKQVRVGSVIVGVMLGLLVGATPAGPATAHSIEAAGSWVWAKVSSL